MGATVAGPSYSRHLPTRRTFAAAAPDGDRAVHLFGMRNPNIFQAFACHNWSKYLYIYLYMVQISVYLFSIAWHHRAYISMLCNCLKWGLIANFQRIWMIIDSYRVLLGLERLGSMLFLVGNSSQCISAISLSTCMFSVRGFTQNAICSAVFFSILICSKQLPHAFLGYPLDVDRTSVSLRELQLSCQP